MDVQTWMMIGMLVAIALGAAYLIIGHRRGWFEDK